MTKNKWIICDCCAGSGKVDHPAFDNGITSSEWADMDQDGRDSYMAGDYDVPCAECSGSGKVQVPDVAAMTFSEKREYIKASREAQQEARWNAEFEAECEAERRMGC